MNALGVKIFKIPIFCTASSRSAPEIKLTVKGAFSLPFRKCGTRRDRRERRPATEALSDLMRSESLENYDNFLQEDAGTKEACQWTRT